MMRKVLLTTTALIALGSVSAVAADISISGNARFRYNTWTDDNAAVAGANNNSMTDVLQLWVKSSATLDNGLSIGTNHRFLTNGTVDRNWIDIDGDFGKIDLGKQWSVNYSSSLDENWAGTVAGGAYIGGSTNAGLAALGDQTTGFLGGGKGNKVVYHMPSIGGLSAAISYGDAGAASEADETATAVGYNMDVLGGSLRLQYANIVTDGANASSDETAGTEYGAEYSSSFGRVYMISQNTETTTSAGAKTSDVEGTTFGAQYNLNSATKLVYYRREMEQDGTTNLGDDFSSDTIGVRYDMTGGLRIGILHTNYDFNDASAAATSDNGSATRLQVRVNF
jgi:hypothetical protein